MIFTPPFATSVHCAYPSAIIFANACGEAIFGWPCDEAVEKLRTAYFNEPDLIKRKAVLEDLSKAAWASLPSLLTGMYYNAYAWRAEVKGLLKSPQLVFWNVEKTK